MTNFIQYIDAGLGRSVQLADGEFLDEWLVDSDNMIVLERVITECGQRILITVFLKACAYFMESVMESMRVGCF